MLKYSRDCTSMNLSRLWSLGISELRTCRRSVGAWVIVAIACAVTLVHWVALTLHYAMSGADVLVLGLVGPRYTFPEIGSTMLLMFSMGVIFLASDMRSRDIRNKIDEVLDAQPVWDLEALFARLMGIVIFLAISATILTLVLCGYGLIADMFSFPIGTPIEPFSALAFLVWDIIPNLALWGAVAILLTQVIRLHFLGVLATLLILGCFYVLGIVLPFSVSSVLTMNSGASVYPSELAPTFVTWIVLLNRFLMVALAGGCLALAALLQSRIQSTKTFAQLLFFGGFAVLFAVGGITSHLMGHESHNKSTVMNWTYAHKDKQLHSSTDIQMISGSIDIRPGRSISLDLELTMESAKELDADGWLFSLNPGYRITELAVNGEPSSDYTFEKGLLSIPRVDSASPQKVRMVASGKPDERFAYLDTSLDWKELNSIGAKRLFQLGQKSYIFHPDFVALMPGISWIPAAGSAYGAANLESRPRDYFFLDIEVSVPKGWLIAAPGSRDLLDSSRRSTYRLRTRNPIPELALVSSKFEQRLIEVDGVEYEVLLNKKHAKNLYTFAECASQIEDWVRDESKRLQDIGLPYPYSRLSLVEVPTSLRTYGGGWRMDSVYSAPGIHMIRESGFPVAPFDQSFSWVRDYFAESDYRKFLLDHLIGYFARDLHGGNPFVGIPRNFLDYQTAPTGHGATALSFVANELVMKIATTNAGYFSVHSILERGSDVSSSTATQAGSTLGSGFVLLSNWRAEFADRPSVWNLLESTPPYLLDYQSDPKNAFHALVLKGQRVADAVFDKYGEELVAEFLNLLVSRFRGQSYTERDFHRTALDIGIDFEAVAGDWLNQTGMAGFVVNNLKNERLSNDVEGETRYQTSFVLANREPVPGVVKVSYVPTGTIGYLGGPIVLDPVHMEGNTVVRVAFQDNAPTQRIWLEPRLSLNRNYIRLDFAELSDDAPADSPTLPYITPIDWEFSESHVITVDDLDDGFSIEGLPLESGRSSIPGWIEYMAAVPEQDLDKGLPVPKRRMQFWGIESRTNPLFVIVSRLQARERENSWFRDSDPTSYGKYRNTYAGKSGGLDESTPLFSTTLPTAGLWKLDYHIPPAMRTSIPLNSMRSPDEPSVWRTEYELGTYSIGISNNELQFEIKFDVSTSEPGWNELGSFELSNSKVDVILKDVSHGLAVADAIRWTPL